MGRNIVILSPESDGVRGGNQVSADRWAEQFKQLGHRVFRLHRWLPRPCDVMVALHARRSHSGITQFKQRHPDKPLITVLTGTDIYQDLPDNPQARESLELAERIVVLQPEAIHHLEPKFQEKTTVIFQSAQTVKVPKRSGGDLFLVGVVANLRAAKDPFRAALAVRRLPETSKIHVSHVGGVLQANMQAWAENEGRANVRYTYLGALTHAATLRFIASCDLICITSEIEGSSNVLSEAVVAQRPVIASRIPGLQGTLGDSYPGYFPFKDTQSLRKILLRCEQEPAFLATLTAAVEALAHELTPEREQESWRLLIDSVV